jgi:hypothetical protein
MMKSRVSSLVALLVMFLLISAADQPENKSEKPPEKKITIAVYPIKMAGADKALTEPLTQILIREISRSSMLTVLEEDMIAEVIKKQGFANSDLCDNSQCQISIGKLTPAQKLVTPELSKLGKKFILDLKVTDIQTGAVDFVATGEKVCTEDDLDQLAAETALELRAKFGEKVAPPKPAGQTSQLTPPVPNPSAEGANILGLKVKEVPYQSMSFVVVESISPDSPCKDIVKPNYLIYGINPDGTSIKDYIFTVKAFDALVSRVKPGTTIGMRVCETGNKCKNFAVKIPPN